MVSAWTFSEAGGHPANEDAFGVRTHPQDDRCVLCALADGQGGQPGGGRAALVATQATLDAASGMAIDRLDWQSRLCRADEAVADDPEAGFTTLVGLAVREGEVQGASCGDSAVYAFDGAGQRLDLTRRQWKNPPVGSREAIVIPFAARLTAPWLILAMSDGVWKYAGTDRVKDAAARLRGRELIEHLQALVRLPGSGTFPDDFTVIVIQDSE